MATEDRRASPNLIVRLFRDPHHFDFFQAVRVAEQVAREWAATDAQRPHRGVGRDSLPRQEAVRFRALPSLGFPGSAVAQVRVPKPGQVGDPPPLEMVVSFLGLVGANGVLPHHYTALLLKRLKDKDVSLRDWLDVFGHRLVSHFYRAWEKYRLPIAYERFRTERLATGGDPHAGNDDPVTWGLYCLVGLGTRGLRGRLKVPDAAFLYYAGHFAHAPRNPVSLEAVLTDYFGLPVEVHTLQGQWLALGKGDTSRMAGADRRGQNNELGKNLIVGRRVWDVQSKFRLRVGPLGYAEFKRLMPSGDRIRPLGQLTRMYVGAELDFDIQPVLKAAEVPLCYLRRTGERSWLGWNTWLHSRPMTRDVDDAVFQPREF